MTSLPYTPPPQNKAIPSEPPSQPAASQKYAASVPISLYRELAGEVKEQQVILESLQQQNQQLIQQNQQLRGEIEQLVRSVVRLQQIAHAYEPPATIPPPAVRLAVPLKSPKPAVEPPVPPPPSEVPEPNPPAYYPPDLLANPESPLSTLEEERPYPRPTAPERAGEMSGIGLAIAILAIAALAGTASFLIVRPLIHQSNPR